VNIELSFYSLSLLGYDNGNIGLGLESYNYKSVDKHCLQ